MKNKLVLKHLLFDVQSFYTNINIINDLQSSKTIKEVFIQGIYKNKFVSIEDSIKKIPGVVSYSVEKYGEIYNPCKFESEDVVKVKVSITSNCVSPLADDVIDAPNFTDEASYLLWEELQQ